METPWGDTDTLSHAEASNKHCAPSQLSQPSTPTNKTALVLTTSLTLGSGPAPYAWVVAWQTQL